MTRIEFHEEVNFDLDRALQFYQGKSPQLPARFLTELRQIQSKIAQNPATYHFTRCRSYRRANFHKFPYHLLYQTSPDSSKAVIIVIRHNHQNPGFGTDRA